MERTFGVGDHVMYPGNGICTIRDIRREKFTGLDEKLYYVMDPVYEKGARFFLPAEDGFRLRKLLTESDIFAVIDRTEDLGAEWIENDSERTEAFDAILRGGDIVQALRLVKILSLHKAAVRAQNKKFHACDENMLGKAEKVIVEEFAYVLGLEKREVIPYIVDYITRRKEEYDDKGRGPGTHRADPVCLCAGSAGQQGQDRPL